MMPKPAGTTLVAAIGADLRTALEPLLTAVEWLTEQIDIHEGDEVDEAALKDLIRAAVALNLKGKSKPKPRR